MRQWSRVAMAVALSASLAAIVACSGSILVDVNTVPAGTWGGDHATLVVGGMSTIQFDCAHGTLDSPIHVDRDHRFDVSGIFVREHGGPVMVGQPEDRHAAQFFGSMDGGQLTLFIAVTDLSLQLGPFVLVLGGTSHIVRCV